MIDFVLVYYLFVQGSYILYMLVYFVD